MKGKIRVNEKLYMMTGEKKIQLHFDENMYCFNPKIYIEFESILKNIIYDSDFPKREESKINNVLDFYFHNGELTMVTPIFNDMYIVLKASHMFHKLTEYNGFLTGE